MVNKYNFSKTKPTPPIPSDGIYRDVLSRIWHPLNAPSGTIHTAWIKAHANIHGNEIADRMAKWAARATLPDFHYIPRMLQIFYFHGQPLLSKLSPAQYSNFSPDPAHTDILVTRSFMWHQKYLLTFLTPFKWSGAIYSIKYFAPFYDKQPHPCPFCNTSHLLDPVSYISFCSSTFPSSLRNTIISTWPIPLLQQITKHFLPFKPSMSTTNIQQKLRDQRNIIRSLFSHLNQHIIHPNQGL